MAVHDLTFDEAESIDLDGTGRDLAERFPYTLENLTYQERAKLLELYDFAALCTRLGYGPVEVAERIDQIRASGPTWPEGEERWPK